LKVKRHHGFQFISFCVVKLDHLISESRLGTLQSSCGTCHSLRVNASFRYAEIIHSSLGYFSPIDYEKQRLREVSSAELNWGVEEDRLVAHPGRARAERMATNPCEATSQFLKNQAN
jgi:hypothetical protein